MGDFILKRDTYKKIKSFDRERMEQFLSDIYANAAEEALKNNAVPLDTEKLRKEIGEIKGVGEIRLNEIMAVIENNLSQEQSHKTDLS